MIFRDGDRVMCPGGNMKNVVCAWYPNGRDYFDSSIDVGYYISMDDGTSYSLESLEGSARNYESSRGSTTVSLDHIELGNTIGSAVGNAVGSLASNDHTHLIAEKLDKLVELMTPKEEVIELVKIQEPDRVKMRLLV